MKMVAKIGEGVVKDILFLFKKIIIKKEIPRI
jgi:hypothetical protein